MADLINRQTAINTLLEAYPLMQKEKLVEVMETVPGAEAGDCISRKMAIDEVINLWADKPFGNPTLVEIKGCIEALTSAQPERKTGEWIECEEDWRHQIVWWRCSECNYNVSAHYNFCPNCGADMRGER